MGALSLLLLVGAVPSLLVEAMPAPEAAPDGGLTGFLPSFNFFPQGGVPVASTVKAIQPPLSTPTYSALPAEATDTCLSAIHRGAGDFVGLFCTAWVLHLPTCMHGMSCAC